MSNRDRRIVNDVIDVLGRSSEKIKSSTSHYEADQHRRSAMTSINDAIARKKSRLPILVFAGVLIFVFLCFMLPSETPDAGLTDSSTISNAQGVDLSTSEGSGCGCNSADNHDTQEFVATQPDAEIRQCFLYNEKGNYTRVNVRYYPDLDSEIIGQYGDFTPVMIDATMSSEAADGYEWTQVTLVDSGLVGWAVSAKIQCEGK